MDIKTKFRIGEDVIYKGEQYTIVGIFLDNATKLLRGMKEKPSISLRLYRVFPGAFWVQFPYEDEVELVQETERTRRINNGN